MRLHWLAAAAVFSLASIGSASAAVYGEDFNDSSFKGSTAVNVSDETDHWASAGLYTINNADGWTFTGSAGLYVNNSGPFDGALLLNECCIENGQGAQASAAVDNLTVGGAYKVSFLEWGDNAPGGTYTLYSQIGSSTPFSYNGVDGAAGSNVSGNSLSYDFVATSTSENLLFYQGNSVGGASPIIDNISISAVPEPATWGMLLFGCLGLARWCAARDASGSLGRLQRNSSRQSTHQTAGASCFSALARFEPAKICELWAEYGVAGCAGSLGLILGPS